MEIQLLQPHRHRVLVHRTHATCEQDRSEFRSQQAIRFTGRRHPVGEHDDRAASIAQKVARGAGELLRELAGRVPILGLGDNP